MKLKLIRKADIIVIAIVIFAAAIFLVIRSCDESSLTAEISVDGEIIETIKLDEIKERKEITPDTSPKVTIVAENGEIWFEKAECSDKICISAGHLSKKGDTAVCLPAKTVVSISGSTVDAITY